MGTQPSQAGTRNKNSGLKTAQNCGATIQIPYLISAQKLQSKHVLGAPVVVLADLSEIPNSNDQE